MGPRLGDKCFELHFADGSKLHELNMTQLKKLNWLQPPGTLWPAGLPPMSASALPATSGPGIDRLASTDDWLQALRHRMPGPWAKHHAERLLVSWATDLNSSHRSPPLPSRELERHWTITDTLPVTAPMQPRAPV
jgi:hypothetical protein